MHSILFLLLKHAACHSASETSACLKESIFKTFLYIHNNILRTEHYMYSVYATWLVILLTKDMIYIKILIVIEINKEKEYFRLLCAELITGLIDSMVATNL